MNDLIGRTAVVTGFASGIGASTVTMLAGRGARVIGVDRPGVATPDALAPALAGTIEADLSRPEGPETVAAQVEGIVDILINNAGVAATRPWREVIGVDLLAPRDLSRLLLPKLGAAAVIINVASQAGLNWRSGYQRARALLAIPSWDDAFALLADDPDIQQKCYAIAKEGIIADTVALAAARPVPGLRANAVSPGTVETPLLADFTAAMGADVIDGARTWAGRHAAPEDIAAAIVFLCSGQARWISGIDLPVDGGYGAQIFSMMQGIPVEASR